MHFWGVGRSRHLPVAGILDLHRLTPFRHQHFGRVALHRGDELFRRRFDDRKRPVVAAGGVHSEAVADRHHRNPWLMDFGGQAHIRKYVRIAHVVDGGLTGCLDDGAARIAEIDRGTIDNIARRMVGAHQRGSGWESSMRAALVHANGITMPVLALADAAALLPERGALIGLDLGTKTIGVAASDPDRRVAAPVETIARKRFNLDAPRILALAAERRAVGLVLGLPINMDGSEGPRAQSTRAFARNLAQLTELPIALWDERLSTAAVERVLIAADASRAKRKAVIDQHAAAYILQGALDLLSRKA